MFWERRETVEREEEEDDGGAKIKASKVWNFGFLYGNLTLSMDFVWITWNFKAWYG